MLKTSKYRYLLRGAEIIVAIATLLYFFFLLTGNLSNYTGLHVDEAWMGLTAIKFNELGWNSIHGMNRYTSSLYSLLIAQVFKLNGVSVFSLRLPGAIANFIGILILLFNAHQHAGRSGFWVMTLIFLSFPGLFIFSKVAWEVCAFHLLLISIKVTILSRLIQKESISPQAVLLFFCASAFGIINHFIFISDAIALLLSTSFLNYFNVHKKNSVLYRLNILSICNLIIAIVYNFIKPKIEDYLFQDHRLEFIFLLMLAPLVSSILYIFLCQNKSIEYIQNKQHKLLSVLSSIKSNFFTKIIATVISFAFIILFAFRYFWVFLGTVSSLLPLQRILAYKLNSFQYITLNSSWAAIVILFALALSQKITKTTKLSTKEYNKILFFLYPLFALLILPIFSWRTSSRHFMISCYYFIGFLPLIYDSLIQPIKTKKRYAIFAVIIALNIGVSQHILYLALNSKIQQVPFLVNYPGYSDKSKHFLKQTEILSYIKDHQVCRFGETDKYISTPLEFYYLSDPYPCELQKTLKIDYCFTCNQPAKYHSLYLQNKTQ